MRKLLATVALSALLAGAAQASPILVYPLLINDSFDNSTGTACPTAWTCSGSPAPGFGAYAPTSAQYTPGSDGLPMGAVVPEGPNAAYTPTALAGSGGISQSTTLNYSSGNSFVFDFWIGLPKTEPDGVTRVNKFPDTVTVSWLKGATTDNLCGYGDATLKSLTGAVATYNRSHNDGGACQFNLPSPGAGQWQQWEMIYTPVFGTSGTVGVNFNETSSGTGQPGEINIDLGTPDEPPPLPEPMTLLLLGSGLLGLGLARRR